MGTLPGRRDSERRIDKNRRERPAFPPVFVVSVADVEGEVRLLLHQIAEQLHQFVGIIVQSGLRLGPVKDGQLKGDWNFTEQLPKHIQAAVIIGGEAEHLRHVVVGGEKVRHPAAVQGVLYHRDPSLKILEPL